MTMWINLQLISIPTNNINSRQCHKTVLNKLNVILLLKPHNPLYVDSLLLHNHHTYFSYKYTANQSSFFIYFTVLYCLGVGLAVELNSRVHSHWSILVFLRSPWQEGSYIFTSCYFYHYPQYTIGKNGQLAWKDWPCTRQFTIPAHHYIPYPHDWLTIVYKPEPRNPSSFSAWLMASLGEISLHWHGQST